MESSESVNGDNRLILVAGPARSGKSAWAERLAQQSGKPVTYVATARRDPNDAEWQARIEAHRQRRPGDWATLEVPLDLTAAVRTATADQCWLVDSLGTWLANWLDRDEAIWNQTVETFLRALQETPATIVLVAEEVGWGIVPAYPLGRGFRDRMGTLVQGVGAIANPVYLVAGGHILNLSQLGTPINL